MVVIREPGCTVVKCFIFRLGSCDGKRRLASKEGTGEQLEDTWVSVSVVTNQTTLVRLPLDPICIVTGGDNPSTGATDDCDLLTSDCGQRGFLNHLSLESESYKQ